MRIPITIKVPVRVASSPNSPSLANVVISDISSGLEKITVRILNIRKPPPTKLIPVKRPGNGQLHWQTMPTRFPVVANLKPQQHASSTTMAIPRVHYSVKTIHITLTWPTIPSLSELWSRLTRLSRKMWLRIGIAAVIIAVALAGFQLLRSHNAVATAKHTNSQPPQLTRGTPNYPTVLPAGKTIQQLGGWVRISPPDKDPVYTYVDKISGVQINVSEQPLPAAFQQDTADKIAQLATSYNATDKFEASNNTTVYVGSGSVEGEQSVILAKSGLLILIKSAGPVTNNQWVSYISSLH